MIEKIINNNQTLAIIVRGNYAEQGIHFFTPDDYSQQLGFMSHNAGKIIEPHVHNLVERQVQYTNEVLVIRKGSLRVDFYSEDRSYIESKMLMQGDIILLIKGGHGFEVIEDVEMFEIKQGPFMENKDKTRFHYDPTVIKL